MVIRSTTSKREDISPEEDEEVSLEIFFKKHYMDVESIPNNINEQEVF